LSSGVSKTKPSPLEYVTVLVRRNYFCIAKGKATEGEFWRSNSQSKHAKLQIAEKQSVLCAHMVNTNKKLGGFDTAIPFLPNYFGLCYIGGRPNRPSVSYGPLILKQ